jgi:lipoprotein-anchoring transpeptidase ErfK/SrfK
MSPRPPAGPRAALLAAALLVVVALLTACGADVERPATTTTAGAGAAKKADTTKTLSSEPSADGGGGASARKAAPRGPQAFHVTRRAQLRKTPGGKVVATIKTKTEFKSPTILAVTARRPGWVLVRTTLARHHVGWLPTSAGALFVEPRSIVIDLSAKTLTVLHRGRLTDRYRVAIGTPATPTPTGRFAVTDRLTTGDPAGPYGCCILALSAHSPHAIQGWDGGDRIAIHSTPEVWSIGEAVSHGCLRLTLAEGRWLLGHVPLGTPTLISA